MPHNPELLHILQETIHQAPTQRITFADFMDLVLYHPQAGYYTAKDVAIGPQGDFITSPHLSHDFGELLAVQLAEMWQHLGRPARFTLVEMGAGQGLVAADLLAYLERHYPACFETLDYQIVERSEALRRTQQRRLERWLGQVTWATLDDLPDDSITGCLFSNELVDALPVHLVELSDAGLQEVYVAMGDDGTLQEALGFPSTPRLASYFLGVGVALARPQYQLGYRTEAHLAALDWMTLAAQKLRRGYMVTIDYGYSAERYYGRVRSQGTLQCYYQHAHHNDPYQHLGHQDITAHVNFTALERQGEACGLNTIGSTQQAMFLMALGLGDRLTALAQIQANDAATVNMAIQRRDRLHQLINPMGLGNFIVLVQAKGADLFPKPLKGLTIPPLI